MSAQGVVEIDGVRLAFEDGGEGAGLPLVCLHAIGHDSGDFAPLRARLGDRRILALDWPGQGRSSADRVPPTARRYAELLHGFLDALHLDQVILVGNSIGGAAAMRLAAQDPERVRGLVLMNPGGLDRGGLLGRVVVRLMVAFFAAGARGARWFRRGFALYYKMVLRRDAAASVRERIIADGYRLAPLLRDAFRGFAEPDADLRALAPSLRCPTLFAWAKHDRVVQLGRCRAGIARVPGARLELFDAGHAPQLETPDEFAAAVRTFLGRDAS